MQQSVSILENSKSFFIEIGELTHFGIRFFKEAVSPPFEFKELLRQCYNFGYRSLLLVGVTGFILGLVFTLQSRPTLEDFGAEAWIPSMISISKEVVIIIIKSSKT